jgi:predicted aspartyl protease
MTYDYDNTRYDPPAPVLPVVIHIPGNDEKRVATDALVDTGADIVCCPKAFIDAVGAQPAGSRQVFGVNDAFIDTCHTYFLECEIAGIKQLVEVAALGQELIIGRNLINEFAIKLDGHAQKLSIE